MSESQTKAGNQECFAKTCKTCKTCKLASLQNLPIDLWDMLNNFCFHVYAQKSLFINLQNLQNCKTCKLANLQNLQIDPWDMLNNFCFHVYAQKSHSHSHTLSLSLDMMNKFCFHVYAQKLVFIGQNVNEFFFDILSTQLLFVFRTYFTIVHIKSKYTICGGKNWETPEEKPPANTLCRHFSWEYIELSTGHCCSYGRLLWRLLLAIVNHSIS